jgi:hypothetical protein
MNYRRLVPVLAFGALAFIAAGCGDDGPDATATTSPGATCSVPGADSVVFGEGTLPTSVPGDFPIPADAVVGSTMVDRENRRTEFALALRADASTVVQYYTVSLVSAGFVVNSSGDDALGTWRIEFSRGELLGTVVIQPGGSALAAVVVSFNTC